MSFATRTSRWALPLATIVLFLAPITAAAHSPIGGSASHYSAGSTETYAFAATANTTGTSWLRAGFNDARVHMTGVTYGNNSLAPVFSFLSSSPNTVHFTTRALFSRGECPSIVIYDACTTYDGPGGTGGRWAATNYNSASVWCTSGGQSNCFDAERVAFHELGHVAGLVRSGDGFSPPASGNYATTRMTIVPKVPNSGSTASTMGSCDLIAFQMKYDVSSYYDGYGACADHIPNQGNANGLFSTTTSSQTTFVACRTATLTTTGRVALKTASDYSLISNNPLGGRTVWFDRRTPGGTWTNNVTSTSSVTGTNNWSRTWSTGGSSDITYEIRAHYDGERANSTGVISSPTNTTSGEWVVSGSTSPVFTIQFLQSAC